MRVNEGEYHAVFTLARPGFPPLKEYDLSDAAILEGNSHLAITAEAHEAASYLKGKLSIRASTDHGTFEFIGSANKDGFLVKIEAAVVAETFIDAQRVAFKAVAPCLSQWSLQLDIPLHVYQLDLTEVSSGMRRITFTAPFHSVPMIVPATAASDADLKGLGSLYREA